MSIPNTLFGVGLAAAIGFAGGYYTKGEFIQADEVKQARKDAKVTAQGIVKAIDNSQKVEETVNKSNKTVTDIQQAIAKRPKLVKPAAKAQPKSAPNQEESNGHKTNSQSKPTVASCNAYELDLGTVRLLNAARKGFGLDAIGGLDEALSAPSGITIDKLLQNDLEVVKIYHDLAKRHDQLVTEVEEKLKKQAE